MTSISSRRRRLSAFRSRARDSSRSSIGSWHGSLSCSVTPRRSKVAWHSSFVSSAHGPRRTSISASWVRPLGFSSDFNGPAASISTTSYPSRSSTDRRRPDIQAEGREVRRLPVPCRGQARGKALRAAVRHRRCVRRPDLRCAGNCRSGRHLRVRRHCTSDDPHLSDRDAHRGEAARIHASAKATKLAREGPAGSRAARHYPVYRGRSSAYCDRANVRVPRHARSA